MRPSFDQPLWLMLLALAVPVVYGSIRWFPGMSAPRRVSVAGLRVALIALVACALAGLSLVRPSDRLVVFGVVDASASVRSFVPPDEATGRDATSRAIALFDRASREAGEDDRVGLIVFDGRALLLAPAARGGLGDVSTQFDQVEGTDIQSAVALARTLIGDTERGRIVLVSDGNETSGGVLRELGAQTRPSGLPLDTIPLTYSVRNETVVEFLDAPAVAAPDSTVRLRVGLATTDGASGRLSLYHEGAAIDLTPGEPGLSRALTLRPGRSVELVEVTLPPGAIHRFEAVFENDTGDTVAENNRAGAFTMSNSTGSVLLVDGVSDASPDGAGATLADAIRDSGLTVTVTSKTGFPIDPLDLFRHDLVILQNVPAESLSDTQQTMLAGAVSELGIGLIVIGGPDSLGPGGWIGSPVADILPVDLRPQEKFTEADVAVVFVLDCSGSMAWAVMGSTRSQQRIANEAAAAAIRRLPPTDMVGVIRFSNRHNVVVPLAENTDPARNADAVLGITSGGGTVIGGALREAAKQLAGAKAKSRSIILLTDGSSQDNDELPGLARDIAREGIAISTISIGDEADTRTLQSIADAAGGTFYEVINPAALPRIFLRAISVARSPQVRQGEFAPVTERAGSAVMGGLGAPPTLDALVLTRAIDNPLVSLEMTGPEGLPLLATRRVGAGRTAVFTSDAHEWAARWLTWNGYRAFWSRIATSTARSVESRGFEVSVTHAPGELRLRLQSVESSGPSPTLDSVPVSVYSPSGEVIEAAMSQTGAGRYEARVPVNEPGAYVAVAVPIARESTGTRRLAPVVGGVTAPMSAERRTLTSNDTLMKSIANATGGRVLSIDTDPATLFDRAGMPRASSRTPMWPALLPWLIVVLLADIATRRIAWDRLLSGRFERARLEAEQKRVRSQAESTLRGLRARGERVTRSTRDAATALDDDQASKVARDAMVKRVEQRRRAAVAAREGDNASSRSTPAPVSRSSSDKDTAPERSDARSHDGNDVPQPTDPEDTREDGLLAAKRRARRKFGESEG